VVLPNIIGHCVYQLGAKKFFGLVLTENDLFETLDAAKATNIDVQIEVDEIIAKTYQVSFSTHSCSCKWSLSFTHVLHDKT
jgi:hypothetical protein